jgi:tetratricopeptide (TPR) repeat protein
MVILRVLAILLLMAVTPEQDRLWHYRNLGKAFYENPTTQKEAVEQFRKVLSLAPDSARERVNFGLALLKAGETREAVAELEKAQKQDPSIPHTWFNLGLVAKRDGDYDRGIVQMEQMAKLTPNEPTVHHNLAALYKLAGRNDDAVREFEAAELLNPALAAPHFQLYNAYRQAGRAADAARELAAFQDAKKKQEGTPIAENMEANNYTEIYETITPSVPDEPVVKYSDRVLERDISGISAVGGDLLAWSPRGVSLYRNGTTRVPKFGLEGLKDVVSISAGDFDNDGTLDLCVITKTGAALYRNQKGTFVKVPIAIPDGTYQKAVWMDYDHDYDLDLLLFGEKPVLMRNQGDAGFTDQTAAFPFVPGKVTDAASLAIHAETPARDLVVAYENRPGVLYEDKLGGKFETVPLPVLTGPLVIGDFNHDGLFDLRAGNDYFENRDGALTKASLPAKSNLPGLRQSAELDWNVVGITPDRMLHFFENQSTPKGKWLRVGITGIKNLKTAESATIEVKSGALYQKAIYHGVPLVFSMSGYGEADTVRVTWPNGLIQNEPQQKVNQTRSFPEAQRLSGSCPMIFTWNGDKFEFITDVLGVAPLGASSGDGNYFPVDHDEYVQIPGKSLRERDGTYEVRVTEELHEVSYIDQIRLFALDHPADEEIFTNDKFKSPPFPEFRLFGVTKRIYPVSARDDRGRDIRPALLARDKVYPTGFDRDFTGIANLHTIDLDFGRVAGHGKAVLMLNGWVDWADGSTFLGAAQRKSGGLVMPYLQVRDRSGNWKTVVEDMGIPSGKPKTISVDLTGKFLSTSREVRIVTSLCVYWDEIFLSENPAPARATFTPIDAATAELHFRGFSAPVIDPRRAQPEQFDYSRVTSISQWNPTPGSYTRYGDVKEIVTGLDDRFLIMGSGDEVRLLFPGRNLPALPSGWQRDFILLVDGWAKDADANTAYSQTVEPLPFHGMSAYPYKSNEHFPDDPFHRDYLNRFVTRPALKLIRALPEISDARR